MRYFSDTASLHTQYTIYTKYTVNVHNFISPEYGSTTTKKGENTNHKLALSVIVPEANNSYSQRLANEPLQKLQSIRLTVSILCRQPCTSDSLMSSIKPRFRRALLKLFTVKSSELILLHQNACFNVKAL